MSEMFITPYPASIEGFIAEAADFEFNATKTDEGYSFDCGATAIQRGNRVIVTQFSGCDLHPLTEDMVSEYEDGFDHFVRLMRRSELRAEKRAKHC